MNRFEARGVWNGTYFRGEFRCADQGEYRIVMKDGEEESFGTKEAAEAAAHRALVGYLNGNLVRFEGGRASARFAGDKLFLKGGKVIPVERKQQR